jgi:hypothetical protein
MATMNEAHHARPLGMLALILAALLAIVGVRFWTPPPAIPSGIPLSTLSAIKLGGEWNAPGNHLFTTDIIIELGGPRSFSFLDVSLDNNDTYRLEMATEKGFLPFHSIAPAGGVGLARREIRFGRTLGPTTHLRIVAVSGDGLYSLGHLIVE